MCIDVQCFQSIHFVNTLCIHTTHQDHPGSFFGVPFHQSTWIKAVSSVGSLSSEGFGPVKPSRNIKHTFDHLKSFIYQANKRIADRLAHSRNHVTDLKVYRDWPVQPPSKNNGPSSLVPSLPYWCNSTVTLSTRAFSSASTSSSCIAASKRCLATADHFWGIHPQGINQELSIRD